MDKEKIKEMKCDNCDFEIATVYKKPDGMEQLVIHKSLHLNIVDKERNIGSMVCPNCEAEIDTDLTFWRRF
ncbi:hypothetical protein ACFL03_03525 [Thermodesulfobacteriota bacterium]